MPTLKDVVGIGFGPANIAVAALFDEGDYFRDYCFIDRDASPRWQNEMLFENAMDIHSNIQNIPHRDLATLRDPRSRYTFMNYLHEQGLLLEHLNMDLLMPMRPDFAAYVGWVAEKLSGALMAGADVQAITLQGAADDHTYRVDICGQDPLFARHIVIGTGREPFYPAPFAEMQRSERVFHLSRYKSASTALLNSGARKFAVIGSSQSAVEILLHLSKVAPHAELHSFLRRFAFPLKDTNPFVSEIYFPEFTDLYFNASRDVKARIDRDVYRTNYGAADMDVLQELYRQIYYDRMHGKEQISLHRMTELIGAEETSGGVTLTWRKHETGETLRDSFDGVILATGFRNIGPSDRDVRIPRIMAGLQDVLDLDADGCIQVDRNYRARIKPAFAAAGSVVLNGLCETTHGMGDAGSVSLLSKRAQTIGAALLEADAARTGVGAGAPTIAAQ